MNHFVILIISLYQPTKFRLQVPLQGWESDVPEQVPAESQLLEGHPSPANRRQLFRHSSTP